MRARQLFVLKLARSLGKTIGDLLDSITSSELSQWEDYYAIEPWPWDLQHFAIAKQTMQLAAANGQKLSFRECLVALDRGCSMPTEAAMTRYAALHNANLESAGSFE